MKDIIWQAHFPFLRLIGAGVRSFLHGQTTADVLKVAKGDYVRCCWLTRSAGVKCLIEILFNNEGADVLVLSGDINELFEGLNSVLFPADKVEIELINKITRIQKLSFEKSWKKTAVKWIYKNEYLPEVFKFSHIATAQEIDKWKTLQGIPFNDSEINGKNNPFELGLADLISFDKGCYLGQETVARLIRTDSVKKKLRYWESEKIITGNKKLIKSGNINPKKHQIAGSISFVRNLESGKSFGFAIVRSDFLKEEFLLTLEDSIRINIKLPIGFSEVKS